MNAELKIPPSFNPGISHPLYFIRNGLYKGIEKYKDSLTGKLMDFGSGQKPYRSFFTNVSEYIGVDYDGEGHSHEGEAVDVFYDGKHLPFNDNTFDSVFSSEVFEHIFNLEEILPEINRVMKPGADILITCPFVWNLHEIPVDYARYTSYALKHLFEKNGFEVKAMDKSGNFITTITQMRVLYFETHVWPKLKGMNKIPFLLNTIITIMNGIGVIKNKIFPSRSDWYQSNIVLAKKK